MLWRALLTPVVALLTTVTLIGAVSAQPRDYDRGGDRGRHGPPGAGPNRPGPDRGPPVRGPQEVWELLGEQAVGFGVDRDVIRVGRREGFFSKIALEVRDNEVEILDLKVFFHRGPPQDVRVRQRIRPGDRTRPIDLVGGERVIDRIEIVYRSRPGYRGRAKVAVYGVKLVRPLPPPPPPVARWEELGCSKAGFLPNKDVIRVGRREGRFSQIQLRAFRNKVHILNLRVIYGNGAPDDIPVKSEIRDGGESRPLDLKGNGRFIDSVELYYVAQPSFKGSAQVCIFGR